MRVTRIRPLTRAFNYDGTTLLAQAHYAQPRRIVVSFAWTQSNGFHSRPSLRQTFANSSATRILTSHNFGDKSPVTRPGTTQPTPLLPPTEINNPASWLNLCEPHLPQELRKLPSEASDPNSTTEQSLAELLRIVQSARGSSNIDIITYLGLTENRWDASLWIAAALIEMSAKPKYDNARFDCFSNLKWPESSSLDEITTDTILLGFVPVDEHSKPSLYIRPTTQESAWTLEMRIKGKLAVGNVLQSVANLLIVAANETAKKRHEIMSQALRILARLHRAGWIPHTVFQLSNNEDIFALQQPPLLHQLSSSMLSILSDSSLADRTSSNYSTFENGALSINNNSPSDNGTWSNSDGTTMKIGTSSNRVDLVRGDITSSPKVQSYDVDFIRPGPEIWIEFVLWCCVHGSWLIEGAAILEAVRRVPKSKAWSVLRWKQMIEAELDTTTRNGHGRLLGERAAVQRTISAEVVEALVDGLTIALIGADEMSSGYSMVNIIHKLTSLKMLLDLQGIRLEHSTWDAKIARFAELPDFRIERHPRLMERALEFAETYGRNKAFGNTRYVIAASEKLPLYVDDASAAVLGLYHRTLHTYIRLRDINGALRLLSRLQSMTDKNKRRSIEDFFQELRTMSLQPFVKYDTRGGGNLSIDYSSVFPGVQYPGFYPDIPVRILADLLDLINEAGITEIGRWMIHSEDVDGPLIGEELYGNQAMAAPLIRFAATIKDSALLVKLTQAQTTSISGKTLIALCESHIRNDNWRGVAEVLKLLRDYAQYMWSADDFARLLRPLLIASASRDTRQVEIDRSHHAALLMQRLLGGELTQPGGLQSSELDSIVGVLSCISPTTADICAGLLVRHRDYRLDMQISTFDSILQGALEAFGSEKGRMLWEKWCRVSHDSREVQIGRAIDRNQLQAADLSPTERFFGQSIIGAPDGKDAMLGYATVTFRGSITPQLGTVRLIIQQALAEQRQLLAQTFKEEESSSLKFDSTKQKYQNTPSHEVLEWAANILRLDFSLPKSVIDYELEGYLSTREVAVPPNVSYSKQTMQTWQAFTGTRRQWAIRQEKQLRAFVEQHEERQLLVDQVSAGQRYLLHLLATDFGLTSESFGEEAERSVRISKMPYTPPPPARTVEEVVRQLDSRRPAP